MFKILLAVFLPPVSVFLQSGMTRRFYFNVFLTLCGIIPGIIHSIWVLESPRSGFGLDRLIPKS